MARYGFVNRTAYFEGAAKITHYITVYSAIILPQGGESQ